MQNVIVTGASGFIGNYLVEELILRRIHVYALIRQQSKKKLRIQSSDYLHIIEYSTDKMEELKEKLPMQCYDCCINLAWGGVAGQGRADYKMQLDNVEQAADLLCIMSQIGCRKFIGVSSVSEYECELYMPKDSAVSGGRFIYSIAKQTSHYINKCLSQSYGISYINANVANTYGEYGLDELILHDTILKLLRREETSFTEATQMYDFLYVKDIVNGLIKLSENGHPSCSYYIGSGTPRQLKEYLYIVRDYICPETDIGVGKKKMDGIGLPESIFDISKLQDHTGYIPQFSFEESIKQVIEWYRKQELNNYKVRENNGVDI